MNRRRMSSVEAVRVRIAVAYLSIYVGEAATHDDKNTVHQLISAQYPLLTQAD